VPTAPHGRSNGVSVTGSLGTILLLFLMCVPRCGSAQEQPAGLRGDPAAIAEAKAMVETMGGAEIWSRLGSIHFVHRWYPWDRTDSYVEDEILDLTGPRSRVERKSEIHVVVRAYSPEEKYWSESDGKFSYGSDEVFLNSMARAPFNFFRLVKGVAVGDPFFEIRFGKGDIPGTRSLEFYGPDGVLGGWVILNSRKEPVVKATNDYRYTLGPLRDFGNLRIPGWGVYDNGYTRYEMISVSADSHPPDPSLFAPPPGTGRR